MRGNPKEPVPRRSIERTIPACAGEPQSLVIVSSLVMDYPRVCGGTSCRAFKENCRKGLSPRVRGNPGRSTACDLTAGTIPACAGEPLTFARPLLPGRDYPRVCGGTAYLCSAIASRQGLSPRVRGNLPHGQEGHRDKGTIPACAGEPICRHFSMAARKDYPRVCGGTTAKPRRAYSSKGLSPRVRGNPST